LIGSDSGAHPVPCSVNNGVFFLGCKAAET